MKRMFEIQLINWALDEKRIKDEENFYSTYKDSSVLEWNINHIYYFKIKRTFGKDLADQFWYENKPL